MTGEVDVPVIQNSFMHDIKERTATIIFFPHFNRNEQHSGRHRQIRGEVVRKVRRSLWHGQGLQRRNKKQRKDHEAEGETNYSQSGSDISGFGKRTIHFTYTRVFCCSYRAITLNRAFLPFSLGDFLLQQCLRCFFSRLSCMIMTNT